MSETIPDLRSVTRKTAYAQLEKETRVLLEGITDEIAGMTTIAALLHHSLGFLWTGFYRVVKPGALLRVGPYQGSLGCLEIEFGRGVCGTAAATGKTVIVADVLEFPGHISCDPRSRSEIVVPVFSRSRELIAVLDVDSEDVGTFGEDDREGLEKLVSWFRASRV